MALPSRERRWRSPRRSPEKDPDSAVQQKFLVLAGVIALAFLTLSAQAFRLQVLRTGQYLDVARDNRLEKHTIPPARGLIYDRHGRLVAENAATFSAVIVAADLPKKRAAEIYGVLESLLRVPAVEIDQKVEAARRRDPFTPVVIKREVPEDVALVLAERRRSLPGVDVRAEPIRVYSAGDLAAHLLGYIGPIEPDELRLVEKQKYRPDDRIGKAGVEVVYEGYLRGVPGERTFEVDVSGRELRTIEEDPARPGYNLTLSVDLELQKIVRDILQDSVRPLNSKKAAAIIMDVRTGELLADVSIPGYDNNVFSHPLDDAKYGALINNPDKPLLDRSIAEKFAPGSTFKIITGLAALQEGVATPNTTIFSTNALIVKRDFDPTQADSFPEWQPGGLGLLSFARGIAMSSNIYFYCLAAGGCEQLKNDGLGNERLAWYARAFGLGERTGIDLPGETDGLVGDAVWLEQSTNGARRWFKGDTYNQGIGQGYVEATPLQVVRMAAAVANGGLLLRPKVVREVRDAEGNVILAARPEVIRRVPVDDKHLATMRDAMRLAVLEGTAFRVQVPGVQIAGKTGTAEFGARLGSGSVYGKHKEHGWFVGFAPYEKPEIAVVVFHDEGVGATTATPTAGRIFQAYFDLMQRRVAGNPPAQAPAGSVVTSAPGRASSR